jgi:hypothetical protein
MKRCLFIIALCLVTQPLSARLAVNCKDWSQADWDRYIDSRLSDDFFVDEVGWNLQNMKEGCPENVAKNGLEPCLDRILGYSSHFRPFKPRSGMFSGLMSDKDYYASQPQDIMQLPQELSSTSGILPKNWREIANKNGWKYALFASDTGNSSRLVMHVPGEKYDRLLVYFSYDSRNNDPTTYVGVQMQAIEKRTTRPPKLHFRSWGYSPVTKAPVVAVSGGRCITCHINGPRAIVPRGGPHFATEIGGAANLTEFNRLIVHRGPIDYSQYYNPKYFPHDLEVGDKCMGCHNGEQRSSLAFNIDESGEFFMAGILRKVVDEETMPKTTMRMTHKDRVDTVYETAADYRNKLRKWLTQTKCVGLKPASSSPTKPVPAGSGRHP